VSGNFGACPAFILALFSSAICLRVFVRWLMSAASRSIFRSSGVICIIGTSRLCVVYLCSKRNSTPALAARTLRGSFAWGTWDFIAFRGLRDASAE
jgi:hypothetical protein